MTNQAVVAAVGARILKLAATAFGYPGIAGVGNHVTIFLFPPQSTFESESASTVPTLSSSPHNCETQITLDKSCAWGSVVSHTTYLVATLGVGMDAGDGLEASIDIHNITSTALLRGPRKESDTTNNNKKYEDNSDTDDCMFSFLHVIW